MTAIKPMGCISILLPVLILLGGVYCAPLQAGEIPRQSGWPWRLPTGFAPPVVPTDNPMTPAKVELGHYLFYEKRLSGNGSMMCASCHV